MNSSFSFIWILSVVCVQAFNAPAPIPRSVELIHPLGFQINWYPVDVDIQDIITGFKVIIWTIEDKITQIHDDLVSGLITEEIPKSEFSKYFIPSSDPRVIPAPNSISTSVTVSGLEYNVIYEFRIVAYKEDDEGELSEPVRVKFVKQEQQIVFAQRWLNTCVATFVAGRKSEGETFPYHHTVYI